MNNRLTYRGPWPMPEDFFVHGEQKAFLIRTPTTHYLLRRESAARGLQIIRDSVNAELFSCCGGVVSQGDP